MLYCIAWKDKTFTALPDTVTTNAEAIIATARIMEFKIKRSFNERDFEGYFKKHGGRAICCDENTFFPRGKVERLDIILKPEDRRHPVFKKQHTYRIKRSQERSFVSMAFAPAM